jgi:hypothetical protein
MNPNLRSCNLRAGDDPHILGVDRAHFVLRPISGCSGVASAAAPRRAAAPAYSSRIAATPPFDTLLIQAPSADELPIPLPEGAGVSFSDEEQGAGRIAVIVTPATGEAPRTTLVVELDAWSVACRLTSGQLHRLTNGLAGRGRRNTVRPVTADDEQVHLSGEPETLTVEFRDHAVQIPAGPRRSLSWALRDLEAQLAAD